MKSFSFFLLKIDCFWSFCAFPKKLKLKGKSPDNYGISICKILGIISQYPFTTSEREILKFPDSAFGDNN